MTAVEFVNIPGSTKPALKAAVVGFTPALAAEWLEHKNNRNRPLGRGDVKKYTLAMLGGEWELNAEAVILDERDRLVNGQHRLTAVVQAGETDPDIVVPILVVSGVRSKAFDTFDQGRPRSLADVLAVNQEENAATLAAGLRLLWLRLAGARVSGSGAFRSATAVDLLKDHAGLMDSVQFFVGSESSQGLETLTREDENCDCRLSRLVSIPHASCLHYLMVQASSGAEISSGPVEPDEASTGKVAEFWRGLAFGVDEDGTTALPASDPRKKARTTLLRSSTSESKLTRDGKIGVIIKAWLAYSNGEEAPRQLVPAKGEFPRIGGMDVEPAEEVDEEAVAPPEEAAPEEATPAPRRSRKAKAKSNTAETETAETAGD